MIDLVGSEIIRCRNKVWFTVLTREDIPWTHYAVGLIVSGINNEVYQLPRLPGVLILAGSHTKEEIVSILGNDCYEYKLVQGCDNPELPFTPPV